MSPSDSRSFTFTWRIENFGMCPHKLGQHLASPSFEVNMQTVSKWRLSLYPKGRKNGSFVSCFLECVSSRRYLEKIPVGFEIVLFSAISSKSVKFVEKEHVFSSHSGWGWDEFVSIYALQTLSDDYLPNDCLTVVCKLWRLNGISPTKPKDVCKSSQIGSDKLSIRTTIKIHKKISTWPINNFSLLRSNECRILHITSPLENIPSFYLIFQLLENEEGLITIHQSGMNPSRQTYVRCKVSVMDTLLADRYFAEQGHLFQSDQETEDPWIFPSFVKASQLIAEKYLSTTHDSLFLRCEFTISRFGDISHTEEVDMVPTIQENVLFKNIPNPFEIEFKTLYKEGAFSDVTLQAGSTPFKAHKFLLSARSSFFKSIFKDHDDKNAVEITDISPTTVDRMLSFMYTDSLDVMKCDEVIDLYHAAGWYEVLPLRLRCRNAMKLMLSVENVCEVLSVADLHHDQDLRDTVMNFIRVNPRRVFESPQWKLLVKSESCLAATVMCEICTQR